MFVLPVSSSGAQSDLSDPDTQAFEPMFQPAEASSQKSYFTESPVHTGRSDDFGAPGTYQSLIEFKKKNVYQFDLPKFVPFFQLSHLLKRRSPEGNAFSMKT